MRNSVLKRAEYLTVIDAPPLPPLPTGLPLLFWRLPAFPSVNEIAYLSPYARKDAMKAERTRGYTTALGYAEANSLPMSYQEYKGKRSLRLNRPLTVAPLFCFVEIYRGDKKKRDVYNLAAKAFIDGCTDAGLWVDDNEDYHTDVWVHFASRGLAHLAEIRFYASSL